MQDVRSGVDANGDIDYGNIESLTQTAVGFEITGDFGSVIIDGGRLELDSSE